MVGDDFVKVWDVFMPVKIKLWLWNTHMEMESAIFSVLGSSANFPDPYDDIIIYKDDTVGVDASWDLQDSKSKDDRGWSTFQGVQKFCKAYCLAAPSDGRAV